MPLRSIVANIRPAGHVILEDLRDFARGRLRPPPLRLDEREQSLVRAFRKNGFVVIPNYWQRERALKLRDLLEGYLSEGANRDYDNGAYLRFWDNQAYDEGVRRIYHVEKLVPELREVRHDPFVLKIVSAYYGIPFYSALLMYQYNTKSNANTRYHHVDAFIKEAKSFLYLDDVDEGNGPFTYIRGTHRSHLLRLRKQLAGNDEDAPTSFSQSDLRSVLKRETMLCGSAGTLILADVRGLHRGSPQLKGSRSVLVNYLVKTPEEVYPDR